MSISSDEVNFLIFRYLQESGFSHTAFTFAYESLIAKSEVCNEEVPPGCLISLLQKGLQYVGIEHHLNEDGTERYCDAEFTLLTPHVCTDKERDGREEGGEDADASGHKEQNVEMEVEMETEPSKPPPSSTSDSTSTNNNNSISSEGGKNNTSNGNDSSNDSNAAAPIPSSSTMDGVESTANQAGVAMLSGHQGEVTLCAWNPTQDIIASGSCDHTARMWHVPPPPDGGITREYGVGVSAQAAQAPNSELRHGPGGDEEWRKQKLKGGVGAGDQYDLTAMEWNPEGSLLATGCMDGLVRLWNTDGSLSTTLPRAHTGPIFSLAWYPAASASAPASSSAAAAAAAAAAPRHNWLLTGSHDGSCVVWDVGGGGVMLQQFRVHAEHVVDVCWRPPLPAAAEGGGGGAEGGMVEEGEVAGETPASAAAAADATSAVFASCSSDKRICVCVVGQEQPLATFTGHQGEINAIRWNPSGSLLASASDDHAAKLWRLPDPQQQQATGGCVSSLEGHTKEVYALAWSPTGEGSANPTLPPLLATASFDGEAKLWEPATGQCVRSLSSGKKGDGIFAVSFSPSGELIATGSHTGELQVYNVKDGVLVRSFRDQSGKEISDLSWSRSGDKLVASLHSGTLAVVDMNKPPA